MHELKSFLAIEEGFIVAGHLNFNTSWIKFRD